MDIHPAASIVIRHDKTGPQEFNNLAATNTTNTPSLIAVNYDMDKSTISDIKDMSAVCRQYLSVSCSADAYVARYNPTNGIFESGIAWFSSAGTPYAGPPYSSYSAVPLWSGTPTPTQGCACSANDSCASDPQDPGQY